ncbi:hypothetical protein [Clostridium neonatale]|nr:hypothetical protein [Clostridium neonatale]CAI3236592.1 hypothetical protein CNEO2_230045 [Clostridium neonatale]CAI3242377.1 hypothetical protein CNEO2_480003 [Clostridium neonatale]CAI3552566.1 hypothetical protein CNEO4_260046 [Clostridium neonatale]
MQEIQQLIYNEEDYEEIKNNIVGRYIDAVEELLNKVSMEKL